MPNDHPRVYVGPAGWSYRDWAGRVYPPSPPRSFRPLPWIARFFDLVEVNVSFYRIPEPRMAEGWLRQVEPFPEFRFTAKLNREFTHLRTPSLASTRSMLEFLKPLREAGRLGPVLAQFPWSYRPDRAALRYLETLQRALTPYSLAVEVRHGAWQRDGNLQRIVDAGMIVVGVDQPMVGDSLDASWLDDTPSSYFRLHGRNATAWFDRQAGRDARYDYHYSSNELDEWARRIESIHATGSTFVITNNHFRGQAVANAFELRAKLEAEVTEIPAPLAREFPDLADRLARLGSHPDLVETRAVDEPPPRQGELFG